MFNNFFKIYFILVFIISIFCCFYQFYFANASYDSSYENNFIFDNNNFNWPLPGNRYITSYFGPRRSPTSRCFF